jgi:hypothetical protein
VVERDVCGLERSRSLERTLAFLTFIFCSFFSPGGTIFGESIFLSGHITWVRLLGLCMYGFTGLRAMVMVGKHLSLYCERGGNGSAR